jgi:hypothetical protein
MQPFFLFIFIIDGLPSHLLLSIFSFRATSAPLAQSTEIPLAPSSGLLEVTPASEIASRDATLEAPPSDSTVILEQVVEASAPKAASDSVVPQPSALRGNTAVPTPDATRTDSVPHMVNK